MTEAMTLEKARLDVVAAQLAARVQWLQPLRQTRDLQLGEGFPVFVLRAGDLALGHRIRRLVNRARNTGYWYHQLREGSTPVRVVQSGPDGDGNWSLLNVFGEELAGRISEAITRVDREFPEVDTARILIVPERHAVLLWVEQRGIDRLVSVSAENILASSDPRRITTAHQMLTRLFGPYWRRRGLSRTEQRRRRSPHASK